MIYNTLSKLGHEVLVLQAEFCGDLSSHSRPSSGVSSSRLTGLSLYLLLKLSYEVTRPQCLPS